MDDRNSWLVPHTLVPVPPGCEPYPVGSRWAEADVEAAASAMREVHAGGPLVSDRVERARQHVAQHFSVEALAHRIETLLAADQRRKIFRFTKRATGKSSFEFPTNE
jgi:hypothetical protein